MGDPYDLGVGILAVRPLLTTNVDKCPCMFYTISKPSAKVLFNMFCKGYNDNNISKQKAKVLRNKMGCAQEDLAREVDVSL